jgi:hypothetical protein
MAQERNGGERPVLNPALRLMREPVPKPVTGRSPTEAQVRIERLNRQRETLSTAIAAIRTTPPRLHAGRMHLRAQMYDDSLAPTYLPRGIFGAKTHTHIVAPIHDGYLVEATLEGLDALSNEIANSDAVDARVAISRVQEIQSQTMTSVFHGRDVDILWDRAIVSEAGSLFTVWLPPFIDVAARDSVIAELMSMEREGAIHSVFATVSMARAPGQDTAVLHVSRQAESASLAQVAREYRTKRVAKVTLAVVSADALAQLAASGASFRIDPVVPLRVQTFPQAPDPDRPVPREDWHPIVGVVDGGMTARSYAPMEAWRAPSLVSDVDANTIHGNRVSSLAIHGYAWNSHLRLPELVCRIGTVQAIAKDGHGHESRERFLSYLREVVKAHASECKVWNMSFNEATFPGDEEMVSDLGHGIRSIARDYGILPVVAVGNISERGHGRVCPPGDCEASLTVGGRVALNDAPDAHCPACVVGPGPDGMLKPDLSWFSTLRSVGGTPATGSSFATPLVASLAAHAFQALKNPTPDLVKALLINSADQESFDGKIGWGTPWQDANPWSCPIGTVTLVWTATLSKGQAYYWNDIPIPPEMIRDGKLFGRASLTAVLQPLVSELASANYFSSRLEVALQTPGPGRASINLLGTMRESVARESNARTELAKWHPVRRHCKSFNRGRKLHGDTMRVYARVFTRDAYQFEQEDVDRPQQVAFVLTLTAPKADDDIYSSMTVRLGTYVESAVLEQEIDVQI